MKSVQNQEPASATKEELEELMEEREQTLLEWYERSLIDCSTFDAERVDKRFSRSSTTQRTSSEVNRRSGSSLPELSRRSRALSRNVETSCTRQKSHQK